MQRMKNHVWRPLIVAIGIVLLILAARAVYVPKDFGIYERGYTYSWHRKGDEDFWNKFTIKYRGKEYCGGCHEDKVKKIDKTPHRIIICENCHGPAEDHPSEQRPKLVIDRSREQCYRCHVKLPYPDTARGKIKGFLDPEKHNPGIECVMCHNPHDPKLGGA
jgi:predicted CXXCH cytochrome family protein